VGAKEQGLAGSGAARKLAAQQITSSCCADPFIALSKHN
jgi:hypothetical protein